MEDKVKHPALTHEEIMPVVEGLALIGKLDLEDFDFTYKVTRNSTNLAAAAKSYNKVKESIVKKYVLHDDDKKPLSREVREGVSQYLFESTTQEEKYVKELKKLNEAQLKDTKLYWLKLSLIKEHNDRAKKKKDSRGNAVTGQMITGNMITLINPLVDYDVDLEE